MARSMNIARLVDELSRLTSTSLLRQSRPLPSPRDLVSILHRTKLEPADWLPYALVDQKAPYTRNLINKFSDDSKLMLLVWRPGQRSPIHSHANTHCVMKMLAGKLTETLYHWPHAQPRTPSSFEHDLLNAFKQRDLQGSEVSYMADEIGLHSVANPHHEDYAVSMHLYMTRLGPYASHPLTFDQTTGVGQVQTKTVLYSEGGMRL